MRLSGAKSAIAVGVVLILISVGFLWSIPVKRPSLKLILLSATNGVQTGTSWGTFRLENKSTNTLGAVSGYFEERTAFGWAKVTGGYDPRPGAASLYPPLLKPGSLTFQTAVPSGRAAYRLVLEVAPCIDIRDVGKPLPARTDLAYRLGSFLLRHGLLPQKYQQKLLSNSRWLETKPFRISSPKTTGANAGRTSSFAIGALGAARIPQFQRWAL